MAPADLMAELGFSTPNELEKYSRDQPRVPVGHGRKSGQFGDGGGSQAFVPPVVVAPSALAPEAGAALLAPAAGLLAFGLAMVIPTPNSGGIDEGTLKDMPDVHYRKDGPAGTLKLTTIAPDGSDVTVHAGNRNGVYVDIRTGQALGRDLGASISLDKSAVRTAIDAEVAAKGEEEPERKPKAATDEPEVCPAPEKDRGHGAKDRALDYEEDVHERVNPLKPIGRGEAVRVWSPMSGKDIYLDDCYRHHGDLVDLDMKPGDLADAKGPGYDHAFAQVYGPGAMEKLVYDTRRQLSAADFRGVGLKLYFAEKGAADLVRARFKEDQQLSKVVISHMPPRKGH